MQICRKHPEVLHQEGRIEEALEAPQTIRRSKYEPKVLLFYRLFTSTPVKRKYLMVAVAVMDEEGSVVTSYFTDRIKMGEKAWQGG